MHQTLPNLFHPLPADENLIKIVFPGEHIFPKDVFFLYYPNSEKFTRLVEYKKFTQHESPTTLISIETPSDRNKHYPLPFESEKAKAKLEIFNILGESVFYKKEPI